MSKLQLSVAVGNYDRVRPLMDGTVQIDGVDPIFMNLPPEEIFFRAFRSVDFDICELSMSSFTVKTAEGRCPYVGVPAFVSRAFRHNSIYVRRDRIKTPEDLKGRRVGLPEFQLTACVWARIILQEAHGVQPSDIIWVRGGIETPGRPEDRDQARGRRAHARCAGGHNDFRAARAGRDRRLHRAASAKPGAQGQCSDRVAYDDPIAASRDYFRRTGIFPIMHLISIRRTLVEKHPWLPAAVQGVGAGESEVPERAGR